NYDINEASRYVFEDNRTGLWIGTKRGVARVDINSQIQYYQLKEITEIENLYVKDYHQQLNQQLHEIIETEQTRGERKNRFLDHLIARFSESLTEYSLLTASLLKTKADNRLINDKQAFLADYPKLSSERGKAFDYRFPHQFDNLTGLQRRVYRLLGIQEADCSVRRQYFASPRIRIFEKQGGQYFFRLLRHLDSADDDYVFESNCCNSQEQVCILIDTLIVFGAQRANWYRLSDNPLTEPDNPNIPDPVWVLKRTCAQGTQLQDWIDQGASDRAAEEVLGFAAVQIIQEHDLQEQVIDHFEQYARREGFHVIENILLRKRSVEKSKDFLPIELHTEASDCECVEVKDPYSFRASIVLPSWPQRFRSTRFRQLVEKTLRAEAPAHVYLRICWINHCEMQTFERCYDEWSIAHANLDCQFKGEHPLPYFDPPMGSPEDTLTMAQKNQLSHYQNTLQAFIEKLYRLNNIFTVARIHGCDDIDSEEPQLSLNNTSLGSI
ncbi:MAG: hypothetical protein AAGD05_16135, partial [Bacteroidota bacterium]